MEEHCWAINVVQDDLDGILQDIYYFGVRLLGLSVSEAKVVFSSRFSHVLEYSLRD